MVFQAVCCVNNGCMVGLICALFLLQLLTTTVTSSLFLSCLHFRKGWFLLGWGLADTFHKILAYFLPCYSPPPLTVICAIAAAAAGNIHHTNAALPAVAVVVSNFCADPSQSLPCVSSVPGATLFLLPNHLAWFCAVPSCLHDTQCVPHHVAR